jgi:hypothetical protein
MQNMDWLEEELGGYEDDYLIIDCPGISSLLLAGAPLKEATPGQIELYTHHPFLPSLVKHLNRLGLRVCALYLIESQFMEDKYKFFRYVPLGNGTCSRILVMIPLFPVVYCRRCQRWSISKSRGSTSCQNGSRDRKPR